MKDKVLLISINKIKKDSYIDENVSEDMIRIAIDFIQDTIIEKVTGTAIYNKLVCFVKNGEVVDLQGKVNPNYQVLLEEYLQPIFIWGVAAEVAIPLSFKNRNIGTFQAQDEKIYATGLADIKYLNQYYKNKMDFYVSRAIDYLRCNKSCFPGIENCGCSWCSSPVGTKQPSTPLNLKF